jgi:hypothetical protein
MKLTTDLNYTVDDDGEIRVAHSNGTYLGYIPTKTLDRMLAQSIGAVTADAIRRLRGDSE